MFPKHKRLRRADFPTALKDARRLSSPHFLAVIPSKRPTPGVVQITGYAVIVSKKTAKLAVTRHRLKRRVLAALRSIPYLPPSLLVYPKASVLDMAAGGIRSELTELLSKTRL